MPNLRSILSLVLVLVAVLLASCGSPQARQVPRTYTPAQIEQIQRYAAPIEGAREQMSRLRTYISENNWVDTRTLIHGPLGQLRQNAIGLSRALLPEDERRAAQLARELFGHFERIDAAAKDRNAAQAQVQFREALEDFDAFLNLIPKAS